MNFLPSTTSDLFGWEDFFVLLGAVAVPGLVFFVWIAFFRKQPTRRKRRRRASSRREFVQTVDLPSVSRTDKTPGEPKS